MTIRNGILTSIILAASILLFSRAAYAAEIDDMDTVRCHVDSYTFAKAIKNNVISQLSEGGTLTSTSVRVRMRKLLTVKKSKLVSDFMAGFTVDVDPNSCEGARLEGCANPEIIAERCSVPYEVTITIVSRNQNACGGNYCERRTTSRVEVPGFFD